MSIKLAWKTIPGYMDTAYNGTQFSGGFDVDVVVSTSDTDDDTQSFKLLQILPGQSDGVIHHSADCLV